MRLTLYPFFSQQNKQTNKFLLGADSGVKLYAYIANRAAEAGWEPLLVLPQLQQIADCDLPLHSAVQVARPPFLLQQDNFRRRLQWDPDWLNRLAGLSDVMLVQHETLAYPLRCLAPSLPIVSEGGVDPWRCWPATQELVRAAWRAATLVHCNTPVMAERVVKEGGATTVWTFAWDDAIAKHPAVNRDIDVLFNCRCSATLYTHHDVLAAALRDSAFRVLATDPTSYWRLQGDAPEGWLQERPLAREEYLAVLARSRTVVSLVDNGASAFSLYEAVAAGAVPVVLDTPEHRELVGLRWPLVVRSLDPAELRLAVRRALAAGWEGLRPDTKLDLLERLKRASYSAAWDVAKRDLEAL